MRLDHLLSKEKMEADEASALLVRPLRKCAGHFALFNLEGMRLKPEAKRRFVSERRYGGAICSFRGVPQAVRGNGMSTAGTDDEG